MGGTIAALGALAASSIGVSIAGCSAAKGEDTCAAQVTEVRAVWNTNARAAYLARAGRGPDAVDDVRWFEDYASRLGEARVRTCKAGPRGGQTPQLAQRNACLTRGLADLRAALARKTLRWWPRLQDLEQCDGPKVAVGVRPYQSSLRDFLSPDGDRSLTLTSEGWLLVDATGRQNALGIAADSQVLRWLPGDRLLVQRSGSIEELELSTGKARRLASSDQLLDVSPDLRHVAVATSKGVELGTLDEGGVRLAGVTLPAPAQSSMVLFSPSGRRLAATNYGEGKILVLELASQRMTSVALRAHSRTTGLNPFAWLDDDSLVLTGSVEDDVQGAVWVLSLSADLQLARAPRPWFVAPAGMALAVADAREGTALVSKSLTARRSGTLRAGSFVEQPALLARMPRAYDSTSGAVLYEQDSQYAELLPDGELRAVPIAPGFDSVYFSYRRGELVGIGKRGQELHLLDARGGAYPLPLELPRDRAFKGLSCAGERCLLAIASEHHLRLLALAEDTSRSVTEVARLPREGEIMGWAISPDHSVVATSTLETVLTIFNLRDGSRRMEEQRCEFAEWLTFSKSGDELFYSCARPSVQQWQVKALGVRDGAGDARQLFETDAWISGMSLRDDGQIYLSTVGWTMSSIILKQARRGSVD